LLVLLEDQENGEMMDKMELVVMQEIQAMMELLGKVGRQEQLLVKQVKLV
jgi:hypothetical protein